MLEQLDKIITQDSLLPEHGSYVVAVSGGRDSVVLLDLLHRLRDKWGWNIVVAHLDHNQRVDSAEDAVFVGDLANSYGYKYFLGVLPSSRQNEANLRQARYDWLEEVRRESGADKIITAHHQNDRLETTIWHTIRGADRVGLVSLRTERDKLVRPLVRFGRGNILAYAMVRNLRWREDASNDNRAFTRNLIRHELMHFAPTQDPHYHNNLASWVDHLEDINKRIDSKLDYLLAEIGHEISGGYELDRAKFLRLSSLVQLNLLAHMARRLNAGRGVSQRNLDVALLWWSQAGSGSFSEALPGLLMMREYDKVKFVSRSAMPDNVSPDETQQLRLDKPLRFGKFVIALHSDSIDETQNLVSYQLEPYTYYIRTWQPGDRIAPIGMHGTKKIQDIFVDKKIPRSDRLSWPIIVSEKNEVVVVPRLSQDRRFMPSGVDAPAHTLAVKVA